MQNPGGRETNLADLPGIALVRVFSVILQRFRTSKFVVARGCGADVALAGDLAGKARNGTSDCMRWEW